MITRKMAMAPKAGKRAEKALSRFAAHRAPIAEYALPGKERGPFGENLLLRRGHPNLVEPREDLEHHAAQPVLHRHHTPLKAYLDIGGNTHGKSQKKQASQGRQSHLPIVIEHLPQIEQGEGHVGHQGAHGLPQKGANTVKPQGFSREISRGEPPEKGYPKAQKSIPEGHFHVVIHTAFGAEKSDLLGEPQQSGGDSQRYEKKEELPDLPSLGAGNDLLKNLAVDHGNEKPQSSHAEGHAKGIEQLSPGAEESEGKEILPGYAPGGKGSVDSPGLKIDLLDPLGVERFLPILLGEIDRESPLPGKKKNLLFLLPEKAHEGKGIPDVPIPSPASCRVFGD